MAETRLNDLLDEIAEALKGVTDLTFISSGITGSVPSLPAAIAYGSGGTIIHRPAGVITFLNQLTIAVLLSNISERHAWETGGHLIEDIPDAIYGKERSTVGFTGLEQVGPMTWQMTGITVGAVEYFSFLITFDDLKYQRTVS